MNSNLFNWFSSRRRNCMWFDKFFNFVKLHRFNALKIIESSSLYQFFIVLSYRWFFPVKRKLHLLLAFSLLHRKKFSMLLLNLSIFFSSASPFSSPASLRCTFVECARGYEREKERIRRECLNEESIIDTRNVAKCDDLLNCENRNQILGRTSEQSSNRENSA